MVAPSTRLIGRAALLLALSACVPGDGFDDDPRNIVWREVLATAGVNGAPRIAELTLEQAQALLLDCSALTGCAEALLTAHPALRGTDIGRGWPGLLAHASPEVVSALLARGARADLGAVFHALRRAPEHRAARLRILRALLEAGAPAEGLDFDGRTPLHHVSSEGDAAAVALLLQHGANPRTPDRHGISARQRALSQGHQEIVQRLDAALRPDTAR